jgi:alpha-L-rhamnosidase
LVNKPIYAKKMIKKNVLFFFLVVTSQLFAQSIEFESLTCNFQTNPIAIDSEQPLLSWIVKAEGFNREQTAYQVLVASRPDLLNEKDADAWNSGKAKSAQSAHIKYKGKKLNPTQKYWWKVKIWDEKGEASEWSPVNTFETGLMNESNWGSAKWISLSEDTRTSEHRFREYKTSGMENR